MLPFTSVPLLVVENKVNVKSAKNFNWKIDFKLHYLGYLLGCPKYNPKLLHVRFVINQVGRVIDNPSNASVKT